MRVGQDVAVLVHDESRALAAWRRLAALPCALRGAYLHGDHRRSHRTVDRRYVHRPWRWVRDRLREHDRRRSGLSALGRTPDQRRAAGAAEQRPYDHGRRDPAHECPAAEAGALLALRRRHGQARGCAALRCSRVRFWLPRRDCISHVVHDETPPNEIRCRLLGAVRRPVLGDRPIASCKINSTAEP